MVTTERLRSLAISLRRAGMWYPRLTILSRCGGEGGGGTADRCLRRAHYRAAGGSQSVGTPATWRKNATDRLIQDASCPMVRLLAFCRCAPCCNSARHLPIRDPGNRSIASRPGERAE